MSSTNPIHILDKRVQLLQAEGGFRTSLDSVMLAAACPAKSGDHVLDLGCGVGSAGFCVLARVTGAHLTGVDIQGDHIDLARQNAALNGVADVCTFIYEDIKNLRDGKFHHVICNPPFLEAGTHMASPFEKKARALGHIDENTNLKDWIDTGFNMLKNGGSLTLIHRADHIDKIIQKLGKKFGAIEIIPLWPHAGEPAKRVIIRALKNRKTPAILNPGLVLHEKDGSYTPEADAVLRNLKSI
ncbi:MAG: tRNA1(Val) (adenine(37)-N6)-methyltransferase [Alphaproteobacteria bacterium]